MNPPARTTRTGLDFFEVASLLQKSLRRGDAAMCARAVNELLPRYANYVWNRLLIVSAEDCADLVTGEIVALYDAWDKVTRGSGKTTSAKPAVQEGRIFISKAIVILAKCRHSRDADELQHLIANRMPDDVFMAALDDVEEIMEAPAEHFEIPEYVYDVHTRRGKRRGRTRQQFLRDEHDALSDPVSIFKNADEMIDSETYVQPRLDLRPE
jgi:replication-associated recombination protein RarA